MRITLLAAALAAPLLLAAAPPPAEKVRKPDLADMMAGTWHGAVISDSQGSSRSDVTLTLTRSGPNQVRITSDYPRLPVVTVPIERAMAAVVQASGNTAFFHDTSKQPPSLDVSFNNEVSWSGVKVGP